MVGHKVLERPSQALASRLGPCLTIGHGFPGLCQKRQDPNSNLLTTTQNGKKGDLSSFHSPPGCSAKLSTPLLASRRLSSTVNKMLAVLLTP